MPRRAPISLRAGVGCVLALLVLSLSANRALADEDAFQHFASELLAPFESLTPGQTFRIVIVPFDRDRIPIGLGAAEELNRKLLAELIRLSEGKHEFLSRGGLTAVIRHMEATGALDAAGGEVIDGLLSQARDLDVFVIGHMRLAGSANRINLSYRAMRRDAATTAAQTQTRAIELIDAEPERPVISLAQGVEQAVRYLKDHAADMTELHLGGIHFEDTGVQPKFSGYLEDLFSSGLARVFSNVITERKLIIRRAQLDAREIDRMVGAKVDPKDLKPENFDPRPGVYVLTGTYWDLDTAIEIRLFLRNGSGETVSWNGRVRADTVSPEIGPPRFPSGQATLHGPLRMSLTTERGKNPSYRLGETMDLLIQSETDIWLYCFYHQADGRTIQIFPNKHYWTRFQEPRLAGGRFHTLPGKVTYPFEFVIEEPTGVDRIQCFATSRDVTGKLPESLRGRSFEPLPPWAVRDLSGIFASLPGADVSERRLVITVQPAVE